MIEETTEGAKEAAKVADVADIVQQIATSLSESAPQVWHGLVEYHRWVAYSQLALSFLYFIISIFAIIFAWEQLLATRKHGDDNLVQDYCGLDWPAFDKLKAIVSFVVIIICCTNVIYQINNIPYTVGDVIVPERAAAIEVITVIRSDGELPQR